MVASMTAVAAVTTVRPGVAGGCADAQYGHRNGQDGKTLSHRNDPLIGLPFKQRAISSTSFVPNVKLRQFAPMITSR
jgi:hypothetical protein